MKKIMILGASILQLPAIKKAKEKGLDVVVVDMNPDAIGFQEDGIEKEIISTIDAELVLQAAKRHKIDGIMTLASDMPMQTIAKVSKELDIVGITEETALKATNKAYMRQALFEKKVPIPLFFTIREKEEYDQAIKCIKDKGYKCIVKPADNSGSRGVTLIKDFNTDEVEKAYLHSKEYSRSGAVLVEEYMEGPEVSVETISRNGVCNIIQITDKLTTGAPYFVEMGHSQPSMLSEETQKAICEVTKRAVDAIGIENGPSHTEIKVTKDGPKIVELGARLGGDCITSHLVPLSTGVDLVGCCIDISMGNTPNIERKYDKGSAIRFLKTSYGRIQSITGVEEAEKLEGIHLVSIVHGVNEDAKPIESSVDRVGFVISKGENAEQAIERCESAIEKIIIEVR